LQIFNQSIANPLLQTTRNFQSYSIVGLIIFQSVGENEMIYFGLLCMTLHH